MTRSFNSYIYGEKRGNVLREEPNPTWTPFYKLRPWALLYLQDFLQKRKTTPRPSISVQGAEGEDPLGGFLFGVWWEWRVRRCSGRGAPPHSNLGRLLPTTCLGGRWLPLFLHFLSNTSGLDLVRMEQGNPRVWLAVMGVGSCKNKELIQVVKEKEMNLMKNFQNLRKAGQWLPCIH